MAKAEMTVHVADLPKVKEYVRQLEDAVLLLWAEMDTEQTHMLRSELPRLMDFCAHLHHSIEHEQAMVRINVWAEGGSSGE